MTSKHQTIIPTILATILIIAVYTANAQLTNTAKIHNTGQISVNKVWAKSGSAEDIQAAVDAVKAAGGGIVYVPAGNFSFNSERTTYNGRRVGVIIPGGVSVIGAGKDITILTSLQPSYVGSIMFYCDGSNDKPIRISGITFAGYVIGDRDDGTYPYVGKGIQMWNCKKFRVDHCKFLNFPDYGVFTGCYMSPSRLENGEYQYYWNWGVIDHCDFDNPYKERQGIWDWGYGVGVFGGCGSSAGQKARTWLYNLSDILGKWDIETNPVRCALYNETTGELIDPYGGKYFRWLVYIEDCTFARCRYGVASNTGGFYVVRHCTINVSLSYGSFAKAALDVHEGSTDYVGGRGLEAYNNTINGCTDSSDQAFKLRCGGGVIYNNVIRNVGTAYWLLKADWATDERNYVKGIYIWNNTHTNVGTIIDAASFYEENVHYFLQPRPNYIPYPYPHPLTQS